MARPIIVAARNMDNVVDKSISHLVSYHFGVPGGVEGSTIGSDGWYATDAIATSVSDTAVFAHQFEPAVRDTMTPYTEGRDEILQRVW